MQGTLPDRAPTPTEKAENVYVKFHKETIYIAFTFNFMAFEIDYSLFWMQKSLSFLEKKSDW